MVTTMAEIDARREALRTEYRQREQPIRDLVRELFAIEERKAAAKRARSAASDQAAKNEQTAEVRRLAGAAAYVKKRLRRAVL